MTEAMDEAWDIYAAHLATQPLLTDDEWDDWLEAAIALSNRFNILRRQVRALETA